MRTIVIVWLMACAMNLSAQSFTQHLQKKTGKGSVVIRQSADIERLVNAAPEQKAKTNNIAPSKQKQEAAQNKKPALPTAEKNKKHHTNRATLPQRSDSDSVRRHIPEQKTDNIGTKDKIYPERQDTEEPIDNRKKVMRRFQKVTGYRIQVYSGGNSRQDRIRAQEIGDKIKREFPDEPVYVHFYSPSWKCRVGNYRTYEEASRMLRKLKAQGFRSATILKGKITVQY